MRRVFGAISLAIVTLSSALAYSAHPTVPRHYTVALGPFTPAERAAVVRGAGAWSSVVPAVFDLHDAPCALLNGVDPDICVYPVDTVAMVRTGGQDYLGLTWRIEGVTRVLINVELLDAPGGDGFGGPDDEAQVVAHELGHAMGLSHDVDRTLMAPAMLDCGGGPCRRCSARRPTARDIAAWYKARN